MKRSKNSSTPAVLLWISHGTGRERLLKALAFAVLLSSSCLSGKQALGQDAPPENPDSIHGTVVNSLTHEPIAHALVVSQDNRFATMTDGQGRFEFTFPRATNDKGATGTSPAAPASARSELNVPSGLYVLTARKPGFLTDQNSQPQSQQWVPAGHEVTISLMPEAMIVGHVALPSSEPADKIEVEIYRRQVQNGRARWVSSGITSTKSDGDFRFAELASGTYKLLTHELLDRDPQTFIPGGQLYGYAPIYYPNVTDFASASAIQLGAGKTVQANLSLVRQPYYPVKVAVANVSTGTPMNVIVSVQGRRGPGYALGYNDREQIIQGLLPNGTYTLEAAGYEPNAVAGSLNVTVHEAAVEGPRMTMVAGHPIKVDVKEEFTSTETSGFTINGGGGSSRGFRGRYLNVALETTDDFGQERSFSLRPPRRPEDESLVIEDVQPGRYWVRITSSRGYASSVTSGGVDLQHEPLVVGAGGASSPIEVTMRDDFAEIEGTIEGANATVSDTAPPSGPVSSVSYATAYVYCVPLPDSPGQFTEAGVSSEGKFASLRLPPGVYRVLAFRRQQTDLEYGNPEAMRAYDAKGQIVRLVAGQKEHLRLQVVSSSD